MHRPFPAEFPIKIASITRKAEDYYLTLNLENATVPDIETDLNPESIAGIGLRLKEFLITSEEETVVISQTRTDRVVA